MKTLHQTALASETVVSSHAATKRRLRSALLVVMSFMLVSQAQADILSISGAMATIDTPVSFLSGVTESSTLIRILDEGVTILPTKIIVNAVGAGLHSGSAGGIMFILPGTMVHTYLVHFDPNGGVVTLSGSVTFDPNEIILGIQTHTPYLDGADAVVGDPGAIYPTGLLDFRAFETLPGTDTVTISGDLESASFSLTAELGIDQARIVTLVPEPATLSLLALGALAAIRKRRR